MESDLHLRLKRLGARFLIERGFQAVALEVSSPIPRHRVDVAGHLHGWAEAEEEFTWAPTLFGPESARRNGTARRAGTVLIECKQSRADFLRDRRDLERLLTLRAKLEQRRVFLEEHRLRHEEPELRRDGESLFPECDGWDYASSRNRAYQATLQRIERVEEQVYGETKFCQIARYRLADRLYLLTPRGLVRRAEAPPGWGLLECPRRLLRGELPEGERLSPSLAITIESPRYVARADHRARLLRNIAVAATAASLGRRTQPAMG